MPATTPYRSSVGRASLVLTNAEVFSTALDMLDVEAGEVSVQADFTVGMLTNVILRLVVSADDITYYDLCAPVAAIARATCTPTADGVLAIPVPKLAGWRYFKVGATGTGTVTDSLLALTYRYLKRGQE